MPSQILHTLFGEDVSSEIYRRMESRYGIVAGKAYEQIRDTHKRVFALGCQGPDIFYHSQGRRPVGLEYGTLLHRRGAGIFTAGLLKMCLPDPPSGEGDILMRRRGPSAERAIVSEGSPPAQGINALGAYALGFMTHAILDRQAHPYIVYKSGWLSPSDPETIRYARSHAFLERIIDVLMLKERRGAEISGWDQDAILADTCANPPPGLRELLARVLVMTFPERAGRDEKLSQRIENTFLDCAGFYRYTSPARTGRKDNSALPALQNDLLAYVYPEELPADIDFLNLQKRPWFYPAGGEEEDLRSFPEIYAGAIKTAADSLSGIIGRYLEEGFFPIRDAALVIGNGGLSIVDEAGNPCAPSRSDPLPLDEVLAQQAVLREVKR